MTNLRTLKLSIALALGVATPALLSLGYFYITGDPTYRPLGQTERALSNFSPAHSQNGVQIIIRWGTGSPLLVTRAELDATFARALKAYDVGYWIEFEDVPGDLVEVIYRVKSSEIGPYPIARAAEGIAAAVAALKLNAGT